LGRVKGKSTSAGAAGRERTNDINVEKRKEKQKNEKKITNLHFNICGACEHVFSLIQHQHHVKYYKINYVIAW
jgi:hypothetical protein